MMMMMMMMKAEYLQCLNCYKRAGAEVIGEE